MVQVDLAKESVAPDVKRLMSAPTCGVLVFGGSMCHDHVHHFLVLGHHVYLGLEVREVFLHPPGSLSTTRIFDEELLKMGPAHRAVEALRVLQQHHIRSF